MKNKKDVTKLGKQELNRVETQMKGLISGVSADPKFKDLLASKLESKIDNMSHQGKMKNKRKFSLKWILALGSFATLAGIAGFVFVFNSDLLKKSSEPAALDSRESINAQEENKLNFDAVSVSRFDEEVNECFEKCDADELYKEAVAVSSDIESYKVDYDGKLSNGSKKFILGYVNLNEKARYLVGSEDGKYTSEVLHFKDSSKIVRSRKSAGDKWGDWDVQAPASNIENYSLAKELDFVGKDGWVVDEYKLEGSHSSSTKTIKVSGHSTILSGEGSGLTFQMKVVVLPNLYITKLDKEFYTGDKKIENYNVNYSDFGKNYGIVFPKFIMEELDDYSAKQLYNTVTNLSKDKLKNDFYQVIYRGDENEPFEYGEGYLQGEVQMDVDPVLAQYVNVFPIGKQEEVYMDLQNEDKTYYYSRDYVNSSGKWTDWAKNDSETNWQTTKRYRYSPYVVLQFLKKDWDIVSINKSGTYSDNLYLLTVIAEGKDSNKGMASEVLITVDKSGGIVGIEKFVTEDGEYKYSATYDYFRFGTEFYNLGMIADPEGKLKEEIVEPTPVSSLSNTLKLNCDGYNGTNKDKYYLKVKYGNDVSVRVGDDRELTKGLPTSRSDDSCNVEIKYKQAYMTIIYGMGEAQQTDLHEGYWSIERVADGVSVDGFLVRDALSENPENEGWLVAPYWYQPKDKLCYDFETGEVEEGECAFMMHPLLPQLSHVYVSIPGNGAYTYDEMYEILGVFDRISKNLDGGENF